MSDSGGEPSRCERCYVRTRTTALPSAGRRAIWFIVSECVTGPPRIRLKASVKSFGFFPSRGRKASDASRRRRRLVVVRPTPYGVGLLRELAGMEAAMGYCTRTHSIVFDMMPEPATISKPVAVSLIVIGTN